MHDDPARLGYADLTPQQVLEALDAVGFRGDGRILQLNSYENRVFQVMLDDGTAVVAKFYRRGRWSDAQIVEEHRFALELAEAEVPVVAPCILRVPEAGLRPAPPARGSRMLAAPHRHELAQADGVELLPPGDEPTLALRYTPQGTHRYAVSPRRAGRAPELDDADVLQRLGGFIGRMHAVGARQAFACRRRLDGPADVREAVALIDSGRFVPDNQREAWRDACARATQVIDAAFAERPPRVIRLHGDCHRGNLLWRDSGAHVVDLDDACMGPAVQDLWMLLSGDAEAMAAQLRQLLHGYAPFMDFDRGELRLIEPLRLLRMIRHNAWVAQRWHDPAFPAAFPDFGASAYWAQQTLQLREQLQVAAGPALDTLL